MSSSLVSSRPFASLNHSASAGRAPIRQVQLARPPSVDLSSLQSGSRVLQDQFVKDAQIVPDLGDTLAARMLIAHFTDSRVNPGYAAGGQASASYSVFPDDYRVPFQKRKLVGIPEGLFQYYNSK